MFERFKRSSNRDVGGNANYENANYQNGPEFQRGDGYANDGATTTQQPVNTGSRTGATAAGDRPASGGTTGYDNDWRAGADYDRDARTGDDHHVGRGGAAVGGAAAGGAA